jgi:dihydroorotate dehydrogenase (fumarate)
MSVDLCTRYLGLDLKNPLVASASPLTGRLDMLRQMEEAGAAALVLPSLFQEQLKRDEVAIQRLFEFGVESFEKALLALPELDDYNTGPGSYLRLIKHAKAVLSIPVIGNLNGPAEGNWARHARLIEEAGADALELNLYDIPADPEVTAAEVEGRYLDFVAAVREEVMIPLAVKLAPSFSSLPNLARRLAAVGVDGLVLFNRFLHLEIDLETRQVSPYMILSTSHELQLPLLWIDILRPQLTLSLAASTGVHTADDVLKLLLVGADVTMTTSAVLRHGPFHFRTLLEGLRTWLEKRGCRSLNELKGSLRQHNRPDPAAFDRANYLKAITRFNITF